MSLVDPFGLSPDPANGDWNELLSFGAHLLLGLGGMIPGIGFVFDLADAVLCYYENDTVGMALSLASAIPFSGLMVGAGQTLKFGGYLSDVIRSSGKMARFADKTADIAKSPRTLLRSGIPEKFAAFTLKGEKAAKILQKGGDALKDVGRVMRHQGEKIYTTIKGITKSNLFNSRKPIFADNNVLINALERGSANALEEIRGGKTFITPNQYKEFLNVTMPSQRKKRIQFLIDEGIEVFNGKKQN